MLIPSQLAVCILLPFYILVEPVSILTWGVVVLLSLGSVFLRTGMGAMLLLKRNIFILLFASIMTLFVLLSAGIEKRQVDPYTLLLFPVRIIAVYNAVMLTCEWLGREGFIFIVARIPSARVRLYLLLVFRSVKHFLVMNRYIIYQLKSRIDLRSRKRFLVPLYYVRTLIDRELYTYQMNQAALAMRVDRDILLHKGPMQRGGSELAHALLLCLILGTGAVMNIFTVTPVQGVLQ